MLDLSHLSADNWIMFSECNGRPADSATNYSDWAAAASADGYLFKVPTDQKEICEMAANALRAIQDASSWSAAEVVRFAAAALDSGGNEACCGYPMSPAWAARDGVYTLVVYRCRHCGRVMDALRAAVVG